MLGSLPDENRAKTERELDDQASSEEGNIHSEKALAIADTDLEAGTRPSASSDPAPEGLKADKTTVESVPASPETDAASPKLDVHTESSDADANKPPSIKALDEEAGPKEFYHPASVESQKTIWLPKDQLGLAEAEVNAIREKGIDVSMENAQMDGKGHVDISGAPPGEKFE